MNKPVFTCVAFAVLAATGLAQVPKSKAPDNATVDFLSPKDGETVSSPVTIRFGLKGIGSRPGWHRLRRTPASITCLVDMAKEPDFNAALPVTDNIRHSAPGRPRRELDAAAGQAHAAAGAG